MELSSGAWLTIIKSSSIIVLFLVTIAFGFAPLKSPHFRSNDNLISYFRSFSAGLFLGMGLLHLLNESEDDYYDYLEISYDSQKPYPFPLLIAIASFSIILLVEKVVFNSHELMHQMADDDDDHVHVDVDDSQREFLDHDISFLGPTVLRKNPSLPCNLNKESENFKKLIGFQEQVTRRLIDNERQRNLQVASCIGCQEEQKDVMLRRGKSAGVLPYPYLPRFVERKSVEKEYVHTHQKIESIGPYIILFALSIHGIFEGIAVGIQKAPHETINLVFAVLLHKWAEALTLGVAFVKGKLQRRVIIIQMLMFAAAGPLGIGIGWGISGCSALISCIFKAISAGTFLYISTSELIVEEFNVSRRLAIKFMLYLLGLIIMALILLVD